MNPKVYFGLYDFAGHLFCQRFPQTNSSLSFSEEFVVMLRINPTWIVENDRMKRIKFFGSLLMTVAFLASFTVSGAAAKLTIKTKNGQVYTCVCLLYTSETPYRCAISFRVSPARTTWISIPHSPFPVLSLFRAIVCRRNGTRRLSPVKTGGKSPKSMV